MSKRGSEPSGVTDPGNWLAALAFQGHKRRKREEEREKSRFAPDLARACEHALLNDFGRAAEEVGETDFSFTFSCASNTHWFPAGENEVFQALPEPVKRMARHPDFIVKVSECKPYTYKISLNVEKKTEELIRAADEAAEASGVPYWK